MDFQPSKHNILGKLRDSENGFIVNPLSKNADILEPEQHQAFLSGTFTGTEALVEKGYLTAPPREESVYREACLDFLDDRDQGEIQIFFVPTYACNFACSYCYQEGYDPAEPTAGSEVVDAFFSYLDTEFAGRRKYITVFGGEPLLPTPRSRKMVEQVIAGANQRKLGLAFVTNGYSLSEYVPLLKTGIIREIQVTLDGYGEVHDKRRMLKGGGATFETIAGGIDAALAAGLGVNLRTLVDKENLPGLPGLAAFAKERGWTGHPLFKTQLGRNYELHTCQANQSRLYDRVSLYEDLYEMIREHPEFLEYHRPAYSLSRFIWENGELPDPLFDSCPGCKTEWAFDYTGRIYSCTATVGAAGEALGTFYPQVSLDREKVDQWEERDVVTIPECAACELRLACGGGCASVAKNKTGRVQSPDCRPVKELLGMGLSLYFEQAY